MVNRDEPVPLGVITFSQSEVRPTGKTVAVHDGAPLEKFKSRVAVVLCTPSLT
jgi:hypothetical protein